MTLFYLSVFIIILNAHRTGAQTTQSKVICSARDANGSLKPRYGTECEICHRLVPRCMFADGAGRCTGRV